MTTPEKTSARAPAPSVRSKIDLCFRLFLPFAFLLIFAGDLLKTYFSGDDFMNLYKYLQGGWSVCRGIFVFWSGTYYRSAGAFLYLTLYKFFGLHPAAFKILVLSLLLVNLGIALVLMGALFRSVPLAALAGLLIAYHAAETQLYYSFGAIYDITCFTFMYLALALFIRWRERGVIPGPRAVLLLVVLQILALDCKEMAVALPFLILYYEAFASPLARKRDFDPHAWIAPVLLGFVVLTFMLGKATGNSALEQSLLYRPEVSTHKYIDSMSRYLDEIFYGFHFFHAKSTVFFLSATAAVALLLRSRLMFFGWAWFVTAFLPLNFIPDRAGFVIYIPLVGLAVALVAFVRDGFGRLPTSIQKARVAVYLGPESLVFFVLIALLLFRLDRREKLTADPAEKQPLIVSQQFAADLVADTPHPQPHAHLLFLNDPFPDDSWTALFLPSLLRHDLGLSAARGRRNFLAWAAPVLPQYDEIYDYNALRLTRIPAAELPARIAARNAAQGFVVPVGGVWQAAGAYEWTKRAFTLQAGCATGQTSCHIVDDIFLPVEAYPTTPIHQVTVRVDGGPPQVATVTTEQNSVPVATELDGRVPAHTVNYQFDATVPSAQHPSDPRELGLVLRGVIITP